MYLKSIDLSGFKSFAEATHIPLDPGIIGVVGPNGCGKTNVSESIRWCLGELSPKSLRTKAMVDIIFNGTRRLSPAAHSQVTLNFDNSDRTLGIDTSEVSVTRKAYRDGSSEYYINKASCRLKDIRNLFRGTGLGEDGYSIMEGRMVEFLLSARPQDRRLMFDEASGAAKFAGQRDEAINKLARIEADLERVQDSIALINTERKHLEDQARKAQLFDKLSSQKKILESRKLIKDLERLTARLTELRTQFVDPKTRELETQLVQLDQIYAQGANLRMAKEEKERETASCNEQYHSVIRERDVTLANLRHCETDSASSQTRREMVIKESEANALENAKFEQEAAGLNEQLIQKREALAAIGEPSQEDAPIMARKTELENQIRALKDLAAEGHQRITSIKNEMVSSNMESTEIQVELKSSLREHKRLEVDKAHYEGSVAEIEAAAAMIVTQFETAKAEWEGLKAAAQELDGAKQRLEEKLYREFPKEEATLAARLEHWDNVLGQDTEMRGGRAILDMQGEFPGVYGPLGKLIHCPPQYFPHLKAVLGERLDWFVAENADAANRALEYLKINKKGRATFILLDKITDTWQANSFAFNNPGVVDLEYLLSSTDARSKKVVLYLLGPTFIQGSSIFTQSVLQGGEDLEATEIKALSALEEREEIVRSLTNLRGEQGRLSAELEGVESKIAEITGNKSRSEASCRELEIELAKRRQEGEGRRRELALVDQSLESMAREAKERLAAIARIQEALTLKQEEIQKLEAQLNETTQNLQTQETELETVAREAANWKQIQLEQQLKYERAQQEVLLLEEKHHSVSAALESARQKGAELKRSSEELEAQLQELRSSHTILQEALADLNTRHQIKANELTELQSAHDELALKLSNLESEQRMLETAVQSLKDDLARQEVELKTLEFERNRTIEESCKFFTVTQEELPAKLEALKASGEIPETDEDCDAQLLKLNERLTRLGAVNFLAQEEYDRLKDRATFLETQKADIFAARDDVRTAIVKINDQISQSFATTFTAVREKFKEIFSKLFEGGEADLVLTNPEDISQTGVEIFAQPPGKKLQSITLLSQGEKALTAVSLLFAFFATRPSPVCVLDEIDAPLDENNVLRFCKMLKEFAQQCQFIIITHNKRTMAIAHTLYGVTMEELGVSKIISVKLEEAVEVVNA